MPEKTTPDTQRTRLTVALDADRLGMLAGAFFGTLVMAFCFWRGVRTPEVFFRAAATFVAVYAFTFFLIRFILRTMLREFVEKEKEALRAKKEAAALSQNTDNTTDDLPGANEP